MSKTPRTKVVTCERVRSDISERNLFASFRKFTAHSHSTRVFEHLKNASIFDDHRKYLISEMLGNLLARTVKCEVSRESSLTLR